MLNGEKLEAFWLRPETKQECPLSPILFNTVMEGQLNAVRQDKEIKVYNLGRNKGFVCHRWHDHYTVSFTLATQNMKYLVITKYVQDLCRKLQNL